MIIASQSVEAAIIVIMTNILQETTKADEAAETIRVDTTKETMTQRVVEMIGHTTMQVNLVPRLERSVKLEEPKEDGKRKEKIILENKPQEDMTIIKVLLAMAEIPVVVVLHIQSLLKILELATVPLIRDTTRLQAIPSRILIPSLVMELPHTPHLHLQ